MIVGICKIDIVIGNYRSLKEKRQMLRKIKDSALSKFKIPVSEVGHNDLWQRSELGFAVVGNSKQTLNSLMDKLIDHIYDACAGHIIDKKYEFIYFNE